MRKKITNATNAELLAELAKITKQAKNIYAELTTRAKAQADDKAAR